MGSKEVFQCMQCGELHEVNITCKSEDNIYKKLTCHKCRDTTLHLWIGNPNDTYYMYNLNADSRYYNYNTK